MCALCNTGFFLSHLIWLLWNLGSQSDEFVSCSSCWIYWGIVVDTQERNFLLHTKQNGVFLSIKWIKIVWRRHWENLAMSQQLETPVKKKSFKLGLNSSWSPTLEETRVELHVVSNSWLKTFHTGIFWVVLLLCSLNVCKFFLQGVKSESNLHLPNLSSDFCCPKTVYC